MAEPTFDELRGHARETIRRLRGLCTQESVAKAKCLVETLRNARMYEEMGLLAEAVSRHDPKDARNRRLYAQHLIETGKATAAIDLLSPLVRRLAKDHPESAEATGLIGRAYKQIFFDAGDKTTPAARDALRQAIVTYRAPFEQDPDRNTWHGVNLLALVTRARRLGLRIAPDLNPGQIARRVIDALEATPQERRNEWHLPTLAEAWLGLDDWDAVERHVRAYAAARDAKPFQIESTLRQFTEVWDIEAIGGPDDRCRGRGLIATLRARLLQLSGGGLQIGSADLQRLRTQAPPDTDQLEALLGTQGPQTYRWWRTGLDRALAVAAVHQRLGGRLGTGFLVRAGSLGLQPPEEMLVLTNFHVVNEHGVSPGVRPGEAEVIFEAVNAEQVHSVASIAWSSPPDRHDAALL